MNAPLAPITPQLQARAEAEHADAQKTLAYFDALPCTTEAEIALCGGWLVNHRKAVKAFETNRKTWTGPWYKAWQAVMEPFKSTTKVFAEIDALLVKKLSTGKAALAAEQRKVLAEGVANASNAASANEAVAAVRDATARVQASGEAASAQGLAAKESCDVTVLDINLVPREYLQVAVGYVEAAYAKGVRAIPGLRLDPRYDFRRTK